jgi:hypothetical protein
MRNKSIRQKNKNLKKSISTKELNQSFRRPKQGGNKPLKILGFSAEGRL